MNIREIPKDGKKISMVKSSEWFMGMVGDAAIDIESARDGINSTIDVHIQDDASVAIEGSVHADVVLRCVKCLEPFQSPVDREFSVVLEPYERSLSLSRSISRAELDAEFYSDNEFDPDVIVFEQIMLSLPLYPLCRPACRGLCSHCGIDLNEHPEHQCQNDTGANSPFREQMNKIRKIL